jgi:acyl carrier protein phosphodiesterase
MRPGDMNYLAHLWLTERAGLPLAGAVLGDFLRGRLEGRLPAPLEASVRLHRRIDVVTDAHPLVVAARARFAPGARRYAGIVLDLVYDHCLVRRWSGFSDEPLADFARRAAQQVAAESAGFRVAGVAAPTMPQLRDLLLSYGTESGVERAVRRVAARLRQPQPMLDAARQWQEHLPQAAATLPELLADLARAAEPAAP